MAIRRSSSRVDRASGSRSPASCSMTNRSYGLSLLNARDDVIAIAPGVADRRRFHPVAVGVGVAGHVEPVPAPAFAVMRRGQQPIDHPVEGVAASCPLTKAVHLLRRRRQPIRSNVPGESACGDRPAARAAIPCLQLRQDEAIQRRLRPCGILDGWNAGWRGV